MQSRYAPHYKTAPPPYNHNQIFITLSVNIHALGILNCSTQICSADSAPHPVLRNFHLSVRNSGPGTASARWDRESLTECQAGGQQREIWNMQHAGRALCPCVPRESKQDQKRQYKHLKSGKDTKD